MKILSEIKQIFSDVWAAFLYVLHGKPDDPKEYADEPFAWWHGKAKAAQPKTDDVFEGKEGGFAVGFDGNIIYSDRETAADLRAKHEAKKGNVLTDEERNQLLAHRPKLTNMVLAAQIKPLWQKGTKYKEIALLVGCSEQYVKFYGTCFEKANRASSASPISMPGEGLNLEIEV